MSLEKAESPEIYHISRSHQVSHLDYGRWRRWHKNGIDTVKGLTKKQTYIFCLNCGQHWTLVFLEPTLVSEKVTVLNCDLRFSLCVCNTVYKIAHYV